MNKYKKSLLSVAASIAISSTILSANYVPLTTGKVGAVNGVDNQWVLFGVSGFQYDGLIAVEEGEFRIAGSTTSEKAANVITDLTHSEGLAVSGMASTLGNLKDLAYLDAITTSPIEVRVDTTGIEFLESEPYRTIYVDVETSDAKSANFAFTYKATLEGHILEYSVKGGQSYEITLNSANTFNNPAQGVLITSGSGAAGTPLKSLLVDEDDTVIDYNFENNPPLASNYDAALTTATPAGHRDILANETLRLYTYDAENEIWDIFDTGNNVATNDFTSLIAGKAYWGRLDNDGDNSIVNTETESGLVLGTPKLTTADYTNAKLVDGWNLISFDGVNSEIRYATTGLILTSNLTAGDLKIIDSSGGQPVTVTFTNDANSSVRSKLINRAIEDAKLLGTIPYTFDLRAFPAALTTETIATANKLALISNKRFSVQEADNAAGNTIAGVTTLTGANPLKPSDFTTIATADLLSVTGVSSAYGEYSLVIDPLVGAGTAQAAAADFSGFEITRGADSEVALLANDVKLSVTSITTSIATSLSTVIPIELDLGLDGGLGDHILLASPSAFSVRDHVFTRVFEYDTNSSIANNSTVVVSGLGDKPVQTTGVTVVKGSTADAAAIVVETLNFVQAEANATKADGSGDELLYVMNNVVGGAKFKVSETNGEIDLLTVTTSDLDMAKGAVKGVYSLGYLAKVDLEHIIDINVSEIPDDTNNTIRFSYDTNLGTGFTGTALVVNPTLAYDSTEMTEQHNKDVLDSYIIQITKDLADLKLSGTPTYTYSTGGANPSADFNNTVIQITGSDIINVTTDLGDSGPIKESFTIIFTAGDEDGNNTIFELDGVTVDLNNSGGNYDLNTTEGIVLAFKGAYDLNNTGASLYSEYNTTTIITTVDGDTAIRFDANATGSQDDIVLATDLVYAAASVHSDDNVTITYELNTTAFVDGRNGATENAVIDTADLGYLSSDMSPNLSKDLMYNNVLSPNYVMDGPLYTMRDNNMALKALVSGTTQMTDGTVAWSSIDLTRKPSQWFNSQDYTLFDTDSKAGYWAFLETDSSDNPLSIADGEVTLDGKSYTSYFDTQNGYATYNYFIGNLNVNVTGLNAVDNYASARVTATIGGETIELSQDSTNKTLFTGSINTYESYTLYVDTDYDIIINVADGLGNNYTKTVTDVFDNVAPNAPDANITDGEITVSADPLDTDVAGFYVFSGGIPEYKPEDSVNNLGWIATAGTIGVVCEKMDAVTATSPATGLSVIAVDGTGKLGGGNASPAVALDYMTILRDRVVITDNAAGDTESTTGGIAYDTSCATTGVEITEKTGVLVASITDAKQTKLAYTLETDQEALTAIPITVYVNNGATSKVISRITYPVNYVGKDVFIQIDGEVFGYTLPTRVSVDAGNGKTDTTSVDLSLLTNNPKTNITM